MNDTTFLATNKTSDREKNMSLCVHWGWKWPASACHAHPNLQKLQTQNQIERDTGKAQTPPKIHTDTPTHTQSKAPLSRGVSVRRLCASSTKKHIRFKKRHKWCGQVCKTKPGTYTEAHNAFKCVVQNSRYPNQYVESEFSARLLTGCRRRNVCCPHNPTITRDLQLIAKSRSTINQKTYVRRKQYFKLFRTIHLNTSRTNE